MSLFSNVVSCNNVAFDDRDLTKIWMNSLHPTWNGWMNEWPHLIQSEMEINIGKTYMCGYKQNFALELPASLYDLNIYWSPLSMEII